MAGRTPFGQEKVNPETAFGFSHGEHGLTVTVPKALSVASVEGGKTAPLFQIHKDAIERSIRADPAGYRVFPAPSGFRVTHPAKAPGDYSGHVAALIQKALEGHRGTFRMFEE